VNLYVSQQTMTGTLFADAAMATAAVPTRDMTAPLEKMACAPSSTKFTCRSARQFWG